MQCNINVVCIVVISKIFISIVITTVLFIIILNYIIHSVIMLSLVMLSILHAEFRALFSRRSVGLRVQDFVRSVNRDFLKEKDIPPIQMNKLNTKQYQFRSFNVAFTLNLSGYRQTTIRITQD